MTTKEYLEIYNKYPFSTSESYEGQEEDKEKIRKFNRELCEKYPWLIPTNRWSGKRITNCAAGEKGYWPGEPDKLPEYDYDYTELDEMPDGWRITFGDQLCAELEEELEKFNYQNKYTITQIKEKWGYLHWYDNGIPVGRLSDYYEIIECDDWKNFDHEHYSYKYVGKSDDENHTNMYERKEILEKCRVWDIIHKYEKLSENTCIMCGKPAHWTTTSWISPYCDTCKADLESEKDFYDSFELLGEEDGETE